MSSQGPTPYRDAVRKAFGRGLSTQATMLGLVNHALRMTLKGDQVNALSEGERKAVRSAKDDISHARLLLVKVSKRIDRENL